MWPVVICTEPFAGLAAINAKAKKVPDVDLVIVPHPLGSRSENDVQALAKQVAERVAALAATSVAS